MVTLKAFRSVRCTEPGIEGFTICQRVLSSSHVGTSEDYWLTIYDAV